MCVYKDGLEFITIIYLIMMKTVSVVWWASRDEEHIAWLYNGDVSGL